MSGMLQKSNKFTSNYEIIEGDENKPVNSNNIPIIQFNIAPHSEAIILLEKTDYESDIDLNSDICFDYFPNIFLNEQKFEAKKYKLRYKNKPIEIYECITEHNTGVFFEYKNRNNEFKVEVTAKFSKFNNLFLNITSSDLESGNNIILKGVKEGQFREDTKENSVTITVEPGETGFFGLSTIDCFEKFSYACSFDYHFSSARIPDNLKEIKEEIEGGIKKDEIREE
jgi:hypothetical protein